MGTILYQDELIGERYIDMWSTTLRYFLEELNLMDRQQIYFQQDEAAAHNVHQVDILLQDFFMAEL